MSDRPLHEYIHAPVEGPWIISGLGLLWIKLHVLRNSSPVGLSHFYCKWGTSCPFKDVSILKSLVKERVSQWSKGQVCLLPIIKAPGSLSQSSSPVMSWTARTGVCGLPYVACGNWSLENWNQVSDALIVAASVSKKAVSQFCSRNHVSSPTIHETHGRTCLLESRVKY